MEAASPNVLQCATNAPSSDGPVTHSSVLPCGNESPAITAAPPDLRNDGWGANSAFHCLTHKVLKQINEWFKGYTRAEKMQCLLLFLHAKNTHLQRSGVLMQSIIDTAIIDPDPWVQGLARLLNGYPETGTIQCSQVDNEFIYRLTEAIKLNSTPQWVFSKESAFMTPASGAATNAEPKPKEPVDCIFTQSAAEMDQWIELDMLEQLHGIAGICDDADVSETTAASSSRAGANVPQGHANKTFPSLPWNDEKPRSKKAKHDKQQARDSRSSRASQEKGRISKASRVTTARPEEKVRSEDVGSPEAAALQWDVAGLDAVEAAELESVGKERKTLASPVIQAAQASAASAARSFPSLAELEEEQERDLVTASIKGNREMPAAVSYQTSSSKAQADRPSLESKMNSKSSILNIASKIVGNDESSSAPPSPLVQTVTPSNSPVTPTDRKGRPSPMIQASVPPEATVGQQSFPSLAELEDEQKRDLASTPTADGLMGPQRTAGQAIVDVKPGAGSKNLDTKLRSKKSILSLASRIAGDDEEELANSRSLPLPTDHESGHKRDTPQSVSCNHQEAARGSSPAKGRPQELAKAKSSHTVETKEVEATVKTTHVASPAELEKQHSQDVLRSSGSNIQRCKDAGEKRSYPSLAELEIEHQQTAEQLGMRKAFPSLAELEAEHRRDCSGATSDGEKNKEAALISESKPQAQSQQRFNQPGQVDKRAAGGTYPSLSELEEQHKRDIVGVAKRDSPQSRSYPSLAELEAEHRQDERSHKRSAASDEISAPVSKLEHEHRRDGDARAAKIAAMEKALAELKEEQRRDESLYASTVEAKNNTASVSTSGAYPSLAELEREHATEAKEYTSRGFSACPVPLAGPSARGPRLAESAEQLESKNKRLKTSSRL